MVAKKIKVIDMEEPTREDIVSIIENEKQDDPPIDEAVEEKPTTLPSEPVVMNKPRVVRATKAKKEETAIEVIPEPPTEPPKEEPKEEENQNVKTVKLVQCPKCNKKN